MNLKPLLLSALLIAPFANADSPYRDLYVFGDSLYDTGNIAGVKFTNRVGPDYHTSAYAPIAVEMASARLGLGPVIPSVNGGNDYAVGGNASAQIFESITAPSGYLAAPGGILPRNSYAQDIAAGSQRINPDALYVMDGGGNDILISNITTVPAAQASAGQLVSAARALLDRGVRYLVMINVPNVGQTPQVQNSGDPANATLISATMNNTLLAGIKNLPGSVVLLDVFSMQAEIIADPAAFGFHLTPQQLITTCFDDSSVCVDSGTGAEIGGANPDPNVFFFNDGVHPTTLGQRINADYMLSVLRAPAELSLLPEMALDDVDSSRRQGLAHLQPSHWHHNLAVGQYALFGGWQRQRSKRNLAFPGGAGNGRANLYSVGIDVRLAPQWYLGGLVSRGGYNLDFHGSGSDFRMNSRTLSVLGGWRGERAFVDGVVTIGDYNYDQLHRVFSLGPANIRTETGDTDGSAAGVSLLAGFDLLGAWHALHLGPLLGYDYTDIDVDGYSEDSGRATALVVGKQHRKSSVAAAGVFGDIAFGGCDCRLHADARYRDQFKDAMQSVAMQIETLPGNTFRLPGYQREDDYWTWDADFSLRLTRRIGLALSYGGRSGANDGQWGALSLNARL